MHRTVIRRQQHPRKALEEVIDLPTVILTLEATALAITPLTLETAEMVETAETEEPNKA